MMFLERPQPALTAEERAIRSAQAKQLLSDPFFMSVMEEAEGLAIGEWLTNVDPAARERCWLLCKGLDTVMATLRAIVADAPPE